MYSDADRDALHVEMADVAFRIGPALASTSYLSVGAILDAARRAKAGGVLAESAVGGEALTYVVVGIGVNLVAPEGVPGATGLGADVDPMALLSAFLRVFVGGYGDAGSGAGFADEVRARWRSVSGTLGRGVRVTQTDGRTIRGRAVDVDGWGGLVLEVGADRITVRSGEVELVR